MEVYEMPITVEESRNYHKLLYQLKALNLVEWIKTYIFTVVFNMIFAFVIFTFSTNLALYIWNNDQFFQIRLFDAKGCQRILYASCNSRTGIGQGSVQIK